MAYFQLKNVLGKHLWVIGDLTDFDNHAIVHKLLDMLGIGFGRKDRGGRMERGLGRLSSSAQIDLLDVFATLSKAIGILDRLDNDKQTLWPNPRALKR